jgi:ribonuclease Z
MIDIAFLGNGSMMPLPNRWLSSILLRVDGELTLLDCGEGTQIPWRVLGWGFKRVSTICLSHNHADHVAGLPGVLHAIAISDRTQPVTIVGPKGTRRVVNGLRTIAPDLPFDVRMADLANGDEWQAGKMRMSVVDGDHRIRSLIVRFDVDRKPEFRVQLAESEGVPRHLWSALSDGLDAEWDNQTVRAAEFLGPPRRGLSVGFMTDTRPTPAALELLRGVDLLIAEGTYGDEIDLENAIRNKHMTFREAAEVARDAGARELILTHFSQKMAEPAQWLINARLVFPNTSIAETGMILTLNFRD